MIQGVGARGAHPLPRPFNVSSKTFPYFESPLNYFLVGATPPEWPASSYMANNNATYLVYNMKRGSSASIHKASHSSLALAISSWYQLSTSSNDVYQNQEYRQHNNNTYIAIQTYPVTSAILVIECSQSVNQPKTSSFLPVGYKSNADITDWWDSC